MQLYELHELRGKLILDSREMLNKAESESRDLTAIEKKEYDKKLVKIDELNIEIEKKQRDVGNIIKGDSSSTSRPVNKDIKFYSKDNIRELLAKPGYGQETVSLGKTMRAIITGDYSKLNREERDAIGVGTGGGNYLISQELGKQLIVMALEKAQVVSAGARYVQMNENSLLIPKLTKMPDTEFKAENVAYSGDTDVNFSGVSLESKTLVSMVNLSVELAEDGHDVESYIETAMAKAIAQGIDKACLTGSGEGEEPKGVINQDGILEQDLENEEITSYDPFSNAYYKVEAENITPTGLIAPSSVYATLDLLKDTANNPLKPPQSWDKLRKFSSNQLTSYNAVMGAFNNLLIGMRTRARLEMTRTGGDTFEKLQVGLRIYTRFDVALSLAQAFCHIKNIGPVSS